MHFGLPHRIVDVSVILPSAHEVVGISDRSLAFIQRRKAHRVLWAAAVAVGERAAALADLVDGIGTPWVAGFARGAFGNGVKTIVKPVTAVSRSRLPESGRSRPAETGSKV
jgi:hypothetical protein